MYQKHRKMLEMGPAAYADAAEAAANYKEKSDELTQALDKETAAMERRNKVRDAKDSADSAERDAADDAAVRGGASPEDVAAKRAQDDAAIAKAKIERDLELKRKKAEADQKEVDQAFANADAVANDPTFNPNRSAELDKLNKEIEKKVRERDRSQEDYETAAEIAPQQIRQVDAKAAGTIAEQQSAKAERQRREQEAEAAKQAREEEQRRRDQERADKDRERQREKDEAGFDRDAAGFGREAVGLVPSSAPARGRQLVENISKRLQDGDQGGELQELIGLLESMANSVSSLRSGNRSEIQELRTKVMNLEGQIKNGRTGK
jgi:hypothetical protein